MSNHGCKKVNTSESQKNQVENSKLETVEVELDPSEALIEIKVLEKKSENVYLIQLEQLVKQSFGFSSYLTNGDSILISSKYEKLESSVKNVIIKDRPKFGENTAFDFRLINPEEN